MTVEPSPQGLEFIRGWEDYRATKLFDSEESKYWKMGWNASAASKWNDESDPEFAASTVKFVGPK